MVLRPSDRDALRGGDAVRSADGGRAGGPRIIHEGRAAAADQPADDGVPFVTAHDLIDGADDVRALHAALAAVALREIAGAPDDTPRLESLWGQAARLAAVAARDRRQGGR